MPNDIVFAPLAAVPRPLLQAATLTGEAMGSFNFQASRAAAANLKAQCAATNGYYCDAGGTLSLTWTPENMAQAATIMGTVVSVDQLFCC